ncbi:MAG: T9SS type A sorting domain-containing protein [Bacteroidetes bacterium]|nr:MAG: T9SS type A sorting domain-containing protein [Bacteroidota bacterium]
MLHCCNQLVFRMKRLLLLLLLFIPFVSTFSQETNEKDPVSWNLNLEMVDPILLPPLNLELIRQEDKINDLDKSLPWRYGVTRQIKLNLRTNGIWSTLENGDRVWRIAIKSPEAINMSVNFIDFHLPVGARLHLYNGDRTDISKTYSHQNNRSSKVLGSWFVTGDEIWVEYFEPSYAVGVVELEIESIIHGYRIGRISSWVDGTRGLNDSGDCNYDVNCFVGSDFEAHKNLVKKSVALLNLGNGYLCSASLINNTFLDKTPFLLTSNHCLDNSDPALWSVRFNWMSPNPICGSIENSADIQSNFTMSGAEFRASNSKSDFALVELYNSIPPSWDVAFAGWDNSDALPEYQVGIHHPNGDIMKICRDDDGAVKEIANGTDVWLIKGISAGNGDGWEIGTTESGSSGSPLFNEDGRIIGQLYAGQSFCNGIENNNEYDIYGRLGISWNDGNTPETRLNDWLDPIGTGQITIDVLQNALNIIDIEITDRFDIFPNPASDYIIVMNSLYPSLIYRFYDVLGREILSGNLSDSENRINVSGMEEGIYFLHLIDEDTQKNITKKIIIHKR